MKMNSSACALLIPAALGLMAMSAAVAGGSKLLPSSTSPGYVQECAACHIAYAPGMLPASSWQRIMKGLDRHYGSDASIDDAAATQIDAWLLAHAGSYKRVQEEPPQDRITRSVWFERKHRKLDASVWRLASVKSAANCGACHTGADRGHYDDDNLRYPEGLGARQRRAWHD